MPRSVFVSCVRQGLRSGSRGETSEAVVDEGGHALAGDKNAGREQDEGQADSLHQGAEASDEQARFEEWRSRQELDGKAGRDGQDHERCDRGLAVGPHQSRCHLGDRIEVGGAKEDPGETNDVERQEPAEQRPAHPPAVTCARPLVPPTLE